MGNDIQTGDPLRYRGRSYAVSRVEGGVVEATNPETGRGITCRAADLARDRDGTWLHASCLDESEIERWREIAGAGPKARPRDHRAALRLLVATEV